MRFEENRRGGTFKMEEVHTVRVDHREGLAAAAEACSPEGSGRQTERLGGPGRSRLDPGGCVRRSRHRGSHRVRLLPRKPEETAEANNQWANFNVQAARLMVAGQNGNSRSLRETDLNNFGPRVGIAYSPDAKTTVRAGGGISYTEEFDGGTQLYKNLPFLMTQRIAPDQNGSPTVYLRNGLPVPVPLSLTDPAINGGSPMAYPQNFQTPKIMQWSFGVQRELLRNLFLETDYVGTRGVELEAKVDSNQPYPGPGPRDPRRPLYSLNSLVGDMINHTNWGGSKYHSLQERVQMRPTHGVSAGLARSAFAASASNTALRDGACVVSASAIESTR